MFYFTRREILHELGSATDSCITFDEPPDKESLRSLPAGVDDGTQYCRGRTYSFTESTDLFSDDHASPNQNLNTFDGTTRTFCVKAASSSGATEAEFGVYKAYIRITLDEYPLGDFSD